MTSYAVRVLGLYAGNASQVLVGKQAVTSGIDKRPVPQATVMQGGVAGDCIANTKHHGGPDQAVYLYTQADAEAWAKLGLSADLSRAYFGENIRLGAAARALSSADVRVGDRFRFGSVLLEASGPRLPCATAEAYINNVSNYGGPFVRDMYTLGLAGIYTRVLQVGELRRDMTGEYLPTAQADAPTMRELLRLNRGEYDVHLLERALASPLATRMRAKVEAKAAASA